MNVYSDPELNNNEAHLIAENESLKLLIAEYQQLLIIKNTENQELLQQAAAGIETKSNFDLQSQHLQTLRSYISELLQKAEAAVLNERELEKQVSVSVSSGYQLEEIKTKYNYLQVQLNDLSERLQQLNTQNTLLQQHTGRISELESLLANAESEIEEWKIKFDQ